MKVILQKDVKEVGRVGDLVTVSAGFARNFLFPRKLAEAATENAEKHWQHLHRVAEAKKKKAVEERKAVLAKLNGIALTFRAQAGESEKLFGTITQADISKELDKMGYLVEKKDIHLEEPIKMLGQHKALVKFGAGLEATLQIVVERA